MIHIIPIDDKIEHSANCKCCGAYLDPDGMWIHHSKDKREQYERNGEADPNKQWGVFWEDEATGKLELLDDDNPFA